MEQVGGAGGELPTALLAVWVLAFTGAVPDGEEGGEVRRLLTGCRPGPLLAQTPAVDEPGDDRRCAPVGQFVAVFGAQEFRATLVFQSLAPGDVAVFGEGDHGASQVAWVVVTEFGRRQRLPAATCSGVEERVFVSDVELSQVRDPHDLPRQVLEPRVDRRCGRCRGGRLVVARLRVRIRRHEQGAGFCGPGPARGPRDGLAQGAGRCIRHLGRESGQFVVDCRSVTQSQRPTQDSCRLKGVLGVFAGQNGGQGTGPVVVCQQGQHAALAGGVFAQEVDSSGHGQR
ncbi:hypothetical protein [Streptomyces shenzhenensis]|uniref:hypothetical protein n=1 Tax=Streptomyces shenzhenensis TaxID=943815 RepID=UPI00367EB3F4